MKEIGKVVEVNNDKIKIFIKRSTACGDCGACQVGKDKLNMIFTTDNSLNAKVGDEVEIEIETTNVLLASFIAYGIPLISLILGIVGGYYSLIYAGLSLKLAQGYGAVIGIALMFLSYYMIKKSEHKLQSMKQFTPSVVAVIKSNNENI